MAIARRFEAEAFYFDARIATDSNFDLLRYAKAFLWVMIHAEISPQDGLENLDHFRSDAFRPLLDLCYAEPTDDTGRAVLPATRSHQGELIFDRGRMRASLEHGEELGHGRQVRELLEFFDGIGPDEHDAKGRQRRRWDRLVALHLLVLAFIHKCGYTWHAEEDLASGIDQAAGMLLDPRHLEGEFLAWLPRMGLAHDHDIDVALAGLRAAASVPVDEPMPTARVTKQLKRDAEHPRAPQTSSGRFRRARRNVRTRHLADRLSS